MTASSAMKGKSVKDAEHERNLKSIAAKRSKKGGSTTGKMGEYFVYMCMLLVILITLFTIPTDWNSGVSISHVWYLGWVTAVFTGFGVLPFFFFSEPNKFWMGISNAVAGGMMIAASYSLASEGANFQAENFEILASITNIDVTLQPVVNTGIGIFTGVLFILATKYLLGHIDHDILEIDVSAQKMVLIVFVMTQHSLTEGIGIGVSFGGIKGMQLGQFISFSLAVHNIPEGLAVGLVLTSRKINKLTAVLWAIFTSLPPADLRDPGLFVRGALRLAAADGPGLRGGGDGVRGRVRAAGGGRGGDLAAAHGCGRRPGLRGDGLYARMCETQYLMNE
eukprot:CAMPEP_0174961652 /NCGR_PEP_ID=MMETSP0004_2-20121128/4360_1 /TAXON_ID=420556 /ORGANISM="Ochromonas sp., Strain CCMP1393" /LENGTH=335 /DNA_ID=CAMNT_0016210123 /DNA_START=26 /DNA_END=1032 /DNA_ORIENTATION=-